MATVTAAQEATSVPQLSIKCNLIRQRDAQILQTAQQRLEATRIYELMCLHCEVVEEVLVIQGTVSTFYLKQLAQEAVKSIPGIGQIINQANVVDRNARIESDQDFERSTRSRDLIRSRTVK